MTVNRLIERDLGLRGSVPSAAEDPLRPCRGRGWGRGSGRGAWLEDDDEDAPLEDEDDEVAGLLPLLLPQLLVELAFRRGVTCVSEDRYTTRSNVNEWLL